jgi:hypothetical protein
VITNAIETKIKEAVSISRFLFYGNFFNTFFQIKESLVLPNLDDLAFFNTNDEIFRGGIWDHTLQASRMPYSPTISEINLPFPSEPVSTDAVHGVESILDEPSASRDIETFVPRESTHLRHRKTLADFRDHASLENKSLKDDLSPDDYNFFFKEGLPGEPNSWDSAENGFSIRKMSVTSTSTSSSKESIHGEISVPGNNATKDNNFSEFKRETKTTIADTMKKWGTWYNKGKRAITDNNSSIRKLAPNRVSQKSSTFAGTTTLNTSALSTLEPCGPSVKSPTSVKNFAQSTADVESFNGAASLFSLKTQRKPVSAPPTTTSAHENGLRSKLNGLPTLGHGSSDDEESHSINPGLTVLRKTTASPKITIPAQPQTDPHVDHSKPIAVVSAPPEATVAVSSDKASAISGSSTVMGLFIADHDDESAVLSADLKTITDVRTTRKRGSSNSSSARSSVRSVKSQDELAKQLLESVQASTTTCDSGSTPRHHVLVSTPETLAMTTNYHSSGSSSASSMRVRRKAVGSGPKQEHELAGITKDKTENVTAATSINAGNGANLVASLALTPRGNSFPNDSNPFIPIVDTLEPDEGYSYQ